MVNLWKGKNTPSWMIGMNDDGGWKNFVYVAGSTLEALSRGGGRLDLEAGFVLTDWFSL